MWLFDPFTAVSEQTPSQVACSVETVDTVALDPRHGPRKLGRSRGHSRRTIPYDCVRFETDPCAHYASISAQLGRGMRPPAREPDLVEVHPPRASNDRREAARNERTKKYHDATKTNNEGRREAARNETNPPPPNPGIRARDPAGGWAYCVVAVVRSSSVAVAVAVA